MSDEWKECGNVFMWLAIGLVVCLFVLVEDDLRHSEQPLTGWDGGPRVTPMTNSEEWTTETLCGRRVYDSGRGYGTVQSVYYSDGEIEEVVVAFDSGRVIAEYLPEDLEIY